MTAVVLEKSTARTAIEFSVSPLQLREYLITSGHTPLPPYIHSAASEEQVRAHYQTIYAKNEGSVAAPTAGLHFTERLINSLSEKDVQMEYLTLHVGAGTFLPIKEDDITKHPMHSEYWSIEPDTIARLNEARAAGKRIISVGTTTARVLETIALPTGLLDAKAMSGETNIFMYPPYTFKFIDALITNFHLPHSTLLALVSAFVSAPNTKNNFTNFKDTVVGAAYETAIQHGYRFYSFGDGMLIY
jgi:S-adenosylmethionine:tRNA ribosyltransferase-isomerase